MDKEDSVYTNNGILLSQKKNEIMPFAATWMDLEIVILSKIHQTENYKYHRMLFMHGILKNGKMNLFTKQKKSRRYRKQASGYWREVGWGK